MTEGSSIRPVTTGDLDALAAMYASHWCGHVPDPRDRMLVGAYCVLIELVRSPLTLVAELDGVVAGVCLGCVTEGGAVPVVREWAPACDRVRAQVLERAKTADDVLRGSLFGDERELERADRFIAEGSPYAEAQLTLFMVDPRLKGRGMGTELFGRMRQLMRAAGATRFFLMTDTSSDYDYYERRGMRCLERHPDGPDGPDSWQVFLFGGEL